MSGGSALWVSVRHVGLGETHTRVCQCPVCATFGTHRIMSYEFLGKDIHRATVVACHQRNPETPILYLDHDDGGATQSFLSWGIPAKKLEPIHFSKNVISHIKSKCGVTGTCGDINQIILDKACNSYSIVWLDYTCGFRASKHIEILKHALQVAPFVCATFNTRKCSKSTLMQDLALRLKKISHVLERPYPYKGRSGYENMIKFTLARRPNKHFIRPDADGDDDGDDEDHRVDADDADDADDHDVHDDHDNISLGVGSKVFAAFRGSWLTGVIMDMAEDLFAVLCDYDGKMIRVSRRKLMVNAQAIDSSSLVGDEIGIPVCLWTKGMTGYDQTKRRCHKFHFKVGRRHYKQDRLKVHAICKDGTIHKRAEMFTISPEQAKCWSVKR